jgi:N-acetylneuraminic acid mutarotase
MYVFGGKDDDNNKLNDLWKLDLPTNAWTEIKPVDGFKPLERSGHSCDIYEGYMVVFGGIYEITKELNDFYLYDLTKNRWITLFEETNSPIRGVSPFQNEDVSPLQGSMSPAKKSHLGLSPIGRKSPPKTSSKTMKPSTSSKIKKALNLNT